MPDHLAKTGVQRGDFPFPITDGPQESRYLTWIRNHSNYMAVRGLLDYIRAVAVLARGALVNAMIGLPFLLVIAIFVAVAYLLPAEPGFHISPWVLGIAVAVIVLVFPYGASLMKISSFRRSLGTGTDSSVKLRDHRERRFGAILIVIVAVAAFESLPVFLDTFHVWAHETEFKLPQLASVMAAVVAVYSFFGKLLSVLGGVAKKVVVVAIGALGLFLPLLVVLFVADYLVFTRPKGSGVEVALLAACLLAVGIVLVFIVGSVTRAFSRRDRVWVIVLLVLSVVLSVLISMADDLYKDWSDQAGYTLNERISDLSRNSAKFKTEVAALAQRATNKPGPELRALKREVAAARPQDDDQPGPARLPSDKQGAGLEEQLSDLEIRADSAGLDEVVRLVEAVRKAVDDKTLPKTSDEEKALAIEVGNLRSMVDATTTLLKKQLYPELVDFVLNDRSRFALGGSYENGKPFDFKLLRSNFKNLFQKAVDDVWYWGDLVYYARLEIAASASPKSFPEISKLTAEFREQAFWPKVTLILVIAVLLWFFCWLTVDINLTSIHGLYRDRLASAFLIGADTKGDVDIEEDLDLGDLSRHEAGSTAPYHLINVALNLQGSRDIGIRDRQSDFFVFSKRFIGGKRTGYCRSEIMERVFPQMSLSTAMAISAAAASPNMGSATNPALVAFMTLLNVRLGIWVPNPGVLQDDSGQHRRRAQDEDGAARGFSFPEVFREELVEVKRRWDQLPDRGRQRKLADEAGPAVANRLVGIGFSGGGIRSATINLGIAQALHQRGIFDHLDYMSTVSGGGYLGSSISALMRQRSRTESEVAGRVSLRTDQAGEKLIVGVFPEEPGGLWGLLRRMGRKLVGKRRVRPDGPREYPFASFAQLDVKDGDRVRAGQRLLKMGTSVGRGPGSFGERFRWRVRPFALVREMLGWLDETHRWVNVSDGGHIENLAGIELLRRRCKYILIGDGEADPDHQFNGLATLMREARIDLGIHIEINVDALRQDGGRLCRDHWAIGRIHYPGEAEHGYLLYMKSSVTGDEDEVIREYRQRNRTFPHESTADQMFNEGQFESYRSLGQHIGEQALGHLPVPGDADKTRGASFADLELWFEALFRERGQANAGGRG